MLKYRKIFEILDAYAENESSRVMLAGKLNEQWVTYTVAEVKTQTYLLSKGLLEKGIRKGDRVAIMSGNRPEWTLCDFACNQIGAAIVPLYPSLSDHDLDFIIQDADIQLFFASNLSLATRIQQSLTRLNKSGSIYQFETGDQFPHWKSLLVLGEQSQEDVQSYTALVDSDDLLTLLYTSGTTGQPKGVSLTHRNVLTNIEDCAHLLPEGFHKSISFLPLCHIFERMVVYLYLYKHIQVYFVESHENLVVNINEVQPDGFTTVPRVIEKVYDKIVEKGNALKGLKKSLFFWAVDLGLRYQEPGKNPFWYSLQLSIARAIIFKKWKAALGGQIKVIISGGAALQPRLARTFWAAGIPLIEGYGLTETSPVIAVNNLTQGGVKFGTVGKVVDSLEVKIAEDDEILCKGPSVFKGYYKLPDATASAIDEEGYFHTGDIGVLSTDGFLSITDRKKEIFKTAGGKYIAPQMLENKLMESIFIAQVMVVGENEKYPSALIVPAWEALEKWSRHKEIAFTKPQDLLSHPLVMDKYQRELDRINVALGQWEKIKKFHLLPQEWTIERGELTPKLSLRRKIIMAHYHHEIKAMYINLASN